MALQYIKSNLTTWYENVSVQLIRKLRRGTRRRTGLYRAFDARSSVTGMNLQSDLEQGSRSMNTLARHQ